MKGRRNLKVGAFVLLVATAQSVGVAECTSFCFKTNEGPFFATNYDFPNELEDGLIFVNPRRIRKRGWAANSQKGWTPNKASESSGWTSEYGSLTFNLAGYQLVWAGINERGLTVSSMMLKETKTPDPGSGPVLQGDFWVQYLLDTCEAIEDVVAALDKFGVETVGHYLFCDRAGRCAVIEFIDGETKCRTGEDLPVTALTNSTYARSLAALNHAKIDGPDPYSSLKRFRTAARCLAKFAPRADRPRDFAFRALHKTSQRSFIPGQESPTQWSIVFDILGKRIWFKTRSHPQVRSIDVSKLDFRRCAAPKMMDVQTDDSGDITNRFKNYSHVRSIRHTTKFLRGYLEYKDIEGPADIRQFTERMVSFFEQFGPTK